MSDELDWAIMALRLEDESAAERWFGAICDAYQAPGASGPATDWTEFVQQLYDTAERAGFDNEKVNWFTEGLAAQTADPLAVIGQLHEDRSALPARYFARAEPAEDAVGAGEEDEEWAKYTPAQWYEYLTQTLGDGWTGWDGSEEYWPTFWEYFLTYAEHAGVQEPATRFLTAIHESGDKVAAFAEHGITITMPEVSAEAVAEPAEEPDTEALLRDAVADAQTVMDAIIAANPELAGMSEAARQQALAEALQEFAQAEG